MANILTVGFAVVWVIVWVSVIATLISSRRKGVLNSTKKTGSFGSFNKTAASEYSAPASSAHVFRMPGQPKKSASTRSPSKSLIKDADGMLLEDRDNDWLAKQIREENRIMRRGSELDAGAAHSRQCQAEALRKKHFFEHDDSIDNPEY